MRNLYFALYRLLLVPHVLVYNRSKSKTIVNLDLDRWSIKHNIKGSYRKKLLYFLTHSKDFRTLFYFRMKSGLVTQILKTYCKGMSNFTIDVNTKIGGGLLSGHPYCTILNAESIGENFYVNQLVTVGEIDGKRPKIGNNVSIYTGAIVIGDITIGDNCAIGAGAVVVKSVPKNSTVVGNPGRIIPRKDKTIK